RLDLVSLGHVADGLAASHDVDEPGPLLGHAELLVHADAIGADLRVPTEELGHRRPEALGEPAEGIAGTHAIARAVFAGRRRRGGSPGRTRWRGASRRGGGGGGAGSAAAGRVAAGRLMTRDWPT